MRISLETVLGRPAEEAWRAFDDPANLKVWQPSLAAFEPLSGAPGEVGSTARLTFQEGKMTIVLVETVTLRRPPEEFAAIFDSSHAHSTVHNRFIDLGDGRTRWVMDLEFKFKGMLKLLGPALRGQVERRMHEDVARFRAALERGDFDGPISPSEGVS